MLQRGAHKNGRRLRQKPLQKAVSETEAEANPGKASWLLKEPAEKQAGCAKQRQQLSNCRSIEKQFQKVLNEDALPASSLAELGKDDFEPSRPRVPKKPRADLTDRAATRLCPSARKNDSKKYFEVCGHQAHPCAPKVPYSTK